MAGTGGDNASWANAARDLGLKVVGNTARGELRGLRIRVMHTPKGREVEDPFSFVFVRVALDTKHEFVVRPRHPEDKPNRKSVSTGDTAFDEDFTTEAKPKHQNATRDFLTNKRKRALAGLADVVPEFVFHLKGSKGSVGAMFGKHLPQDDLVGGVNAMVDAATALIEPG